MASSGGAARRWSSSLDHPDIVTERLREAGERGDIQAVLQVVDSAGDRFDLSSVEVALEQVERCAQGLAADELRQQVIGSKAFQTLADMAVSTAGCAQPAALARMIGAFGRIGLKDPMVLDELSRWVMPGVKTLEPEQMRQMVEGLKAADHSPGVVLLDAVNDRLLGLAAAEDGGVEAAHADAIREGLRGLGHSAGDDPGARLPEEQEQPDRIKYT